MPNASQRHGQLLCLMGHAGTGKSAFAHQAPQPHAVLCIDKAVKTKLVDRDGIPFFPDIVPEHTYTKFYSPPAKDLTNDKELPSRNVFDEILRDIETLKVALYKGGDTFSMGAEVWPLPKTVIIEGMDFVRDHCVNWTLHTQGKYNMDQFLTADGKPNRFLPWQLVASKMMEVFNNLAFLPGARPVNVVVTVGLDEETKSEKINGRVESHKTGMFDPGFGGKMSLEAPRQFGDCWLTEIGLDRKYKVVTAHDGKHDKFRGLRSGRFGLAAVEDVTLSKPFINQWTRLFGGEK